MTEPDVDRRLKDAFGSTTAAAPPCPDSGRIWEACHGLLSPGATADIVDHLAACGACTESWRLARAIGENERVGTGDAAPRKTASSGAWVWLAAAAAVIVAIGVWATTQIPKTQQEGTVVSAPSAPAPQPAQTPRQPDAQIAKAPVMLSASRLLVFRSDRATDTFVEEFGRAIEPYRRDDYAAAITALEALAKKYPDAVEPPFYIGVSLLLSGRPDEARAPLARAAAGNDEALAEHAKKYLALAQGGR